MNDIDQKNTDKGLEEGSKVPIEKMIDIDDNVLDFKEILTQSRGILLDFFRGAF